MSNKIYYQFQKDLGIPVFIAVIKDQFDASLEVLLTSMKFSKIAEKDEAVVLEMIKNQNSARCLSMSEATPTVSRQIEATLESDRYGLESVIPKPGYQVYRYKGMGLLVYSFGAKVWELGAYHDFGSTSVIQKKLAARIMINRFLTWALVPQGILGLWGVAVDEGMVLQRVHEAKGELVFIDVMKNRILTLDGVKKLGPKFKVLRLDPTLHGRNIKMTNEELLSFMSAHCSYLDYKGLSVPVRQMIQTLSKMTDGLVHPEESFRPRTDLSL